MSLMLGQMICLSLEGSAAFGGGMTCNWLDPACTISGTAALIKIWSRVCLFGEGSPCQPKLNI
jgi:hypothetical protein